MALIGKLKALIVARANRPGLYGDDGGLFLQVNHAGSKSWIFRYWVAERDQATGEIAYDPRTQKIKGRTREMGLGSLITVSPKEARERALECRRMREQEIDPIRCPLWVKSRHRRPSNPCPLCPRKRTLLAAKGSPPSARFVKGPTR
jgi:Arm DNA-binding domain